jgi:hypothetical protein
LGAQAVDAAADAGVSAAVERADASPSSAAFRPAVDEGPDVGLRSLLAGEAVMRKVEAAGFVPLRDFSELPDGELVKQESEKWMRRFLLPVASPYRDGVVITRSVHRARGGLPDVLRHDYSVQIVDTSAKRSVIHVVISELVDEIRIEVERVGEQLLELPPAQRLGRMEWLAQSTIQLRGTHRARLAVMDDPATWEEPHVWTLEFGSLEEGARFTSNRKKNMLTMWSWADRFDGGIARGKLFFLGFKQIEPANGKLVFLANDHWFDGKCWSIVRQAEEKKPINAPR